VEKLKKLHKYRWISAITVAIAAFIYYLFAPQILEGFLVVNRPVDSPDALVVMAGSKDHRLPAVAQLYSEGIAPRILLTNDGMLSAWSDKYKRNLYMVEWAREDLLELGVADEDIVLLGFVASGSIHDARRTYEYVNSNVGLDSLLVVTSHYHTRRTLFAFSRIFAGTDVEIGVYPVPKDPAYQGRYLKTYTVELMKLIYYWLRFR
jgi:uncharacterized SAM-binding protein YcdF (DUF218 family)